MTSLPDTSKPGQKKLGLVIDLDTCVEIGRAHV